MTQKTIVKIEFTEAPDGNHTAAVDKCNSEITDIKIIGMLECLKMQLVNKLIKTSDN